MTTHVPVAIIGAGPTGTTAAIMLAQRGLRCLVLDRWPEVYPLPRAVHFDDEVFRIFAGLGLADQIRRISRPAAGMQLVDARLRVLAEFTRDPVSRIHGYPQANMFDQPDLEQALRDRLGETREVELRGGVEVHAVDQIPGGPAPVRLRYRDSVTGAEHEVWADAVLGCDGANSITRARAGSAMEDLGFEQQWLVVDVRSPALSGYAGVQQVCDHVRAATFMMVTPGRYRWEFRLRPGEDADAFTDAAVIDLIRPWLGAVSPDQVDVLRRASYTFRGAVADRWRDRRVFLLGDAAHLTPPFIGQGMCAGIRDAANLTWKLALVLTGKADDRLLDTFESERRPYARRLVQLAVRVGAVMTGGGPFTAALRRAALRFTARLPGTEQKMFDISWPAFPAGPLVGAGGGRPCPQVRAFVDGDEVLLDQLLGPGFAIISRGAGAAAYEPDVRAFYEALEVTMLDAASHPALDRLLDEIGAHAMLIRPDRIIAATGDHADLRTWRRLLESAGITVPGDSQLAWPSQTPPTRSPISRPR